MRLGKFFAFAFLLSGSVEAQNQVAPVQCKGKVYLTFDTGSQSQAELIAQTLRKHQIKASFFLANEKTVNGDFSLDPAWATFWKNLAADGHVFGNHTFDHVYVVRDLPDGRFQVKPQFGTSAGKTLTWNAQEYCKELQRVENAFTQLTGRVLSHYWRAPGGKLTPHLVAAAKTCGYTHAAWAAAGFSGDELPSEKWSNAALLQRSLRDLKDGDIFMAHMGIWSRKTPWAPENLEPLIVGLRQKGVCFATLDAHPQLSLHK